MKQANSCAVLSETVLQTDHAADYANQLLKDLGEAADCSTQSDHPAVAWRRSGLQAVTGLMLPLPLASHADGALMALKAISSNSHALPKIGSQLVGERARLRGITCSRQSTAGGFGRLLKSIDGYFALNLVRGEDWELMPAWLETEVQNWDDIERAVKDQSRDSLVQRGIEMGLAIAKDTLPPKPKKWLAIQPFEKAEALKKPLIVDMSGLWAGPLSSSLLGLLGAQVVKVESPKRPDGMRRGDARFYNIINAGKDCVALDFRAPEDLAKLNRLLQKADVVIQASRPRAFAQLGIYAEEFVERKPGKIWARLTAYGAQQDRIGFGDDIGVSAGLSTVMAQAHGMSAFIGDAIADPINGLHLALAIRACLNQGGGAVLDISMQQTLRYAMGDMPIDVKTAAQDWQEIAAKDNAPLYHMRNPYGISHELGADNAKWLC